MKTIHIPAKITDSSGIERHRWGHRQNMRFSPLRSKRVSQRCTESRRFSPGAPVSSHREY